MSDRTCNGCELWHTAAPGAFDGTCHYFPPQLARLLGELVNVRPITTREDGCHIGYRPRAVSPNVVPLDEAEAANVIRLAHGPEATR